MKQPLIITSIIIGVLLIVAGVFAASGVSVTDYIKASYQENLNKINTGREVTCTVPVSGTLSGKLSMSSPSCRAGKACTAPLSIVGSITGTDVNGVLQMSQSGKVYDSRDVTQNRLTGSSSYGVDGCVPKEATQVRLTLVNEQGGVDDETVASIQ
jgi:hypothetical protein